MESLYKILNVTNKLLHDRGYTIGRNRILSFGELLREVGIKTENSIPENARSRLNYISSKRDNPEEKILIVFLDILNKSIIRSVYLMLTEKSCKNCIIVVPKKEMITSRNMQIIDKLTVSGLKTHVFSDKELEKNVTKNKYVPRHIILSKEDADKILDNMEIKDPVKELPKILRNDPQVKYWGGKAGDIVKIIRPSETTGFTPYLRFVV